MSASQPPRTKATHYLVYFTISCIAVIVLGMVYIEDVQVGVRLLIDQLMGWQSNP